MDQAILSEPVPSPSGSPLPLCRGSGILLAVGLVVGAVLRLKDLTRFDLWYDEAVSVLLARSFWKAFSTALSPTDLPLNSLVLRAWMTCFGDSPIALRLLPVLWSLLTLPLVYLLAKRLYGRLAGAIAVVLVAGNPFLVYYANQVRVYSLLGFLTVASLLLAMELERRAGFWALLGLVWALMLHAHLFAYPMVFCEGVTLLALVWKENGKRGPILKAGGLALLISSPFLWFFFTWLAPFLANQTDRWLPQVNPPNLWAGAAIWLNGFGSYLEIIILTFPLWCTVIAAGILRLKGKREGVLAVAMIAGPLLLLVVAALLHPATVFLPRYFGHLVPLLLVFTAGGLTSGSEQFRPAGAAALGVIVLLWVPAWINYSRNKVPFPPALRLGAFYFRDATGATEFIRSRWQEGDVILHTGRGSLMQFVVLNFPEAEQYGVTAAEEIMSSEVQTPFYTRKDFPYPSLLRPVALDPIEAVLKGRKRAWVVYGTWDLEVLDYSLLNMNLCGAFIEGWGKVKEYRVFSGLEVGLYEAGGRP